MFSYYGSKSKIVDYYPPPKYAKIIEPFAGSARYSLKYWDNEVILVDKYDVVVKIWHYLQSCSPSDIKRLPDLKYGQSLKGYNFDNDAELMLMRFLISGGAFSPNWKVSPLGFGGDVPHKKRQILKHLHKIKHWKIVKGCFMELVNEQATWFIDPPYQFGGHKYIESNKNINYTELAEWCKSRQGQTIVCENTKADWLGFKPMVKMTGTKYTTMEAIWSNHVTNYDNIQLPLFDNLPSPHIKL